MFQAQNRETKNSTYKAAVSSTIIMTMSVTRLCFITQHKTCKAKTKTKIDFLVSDHITDCGKLTISRWFIRQVVLIPACWLFKTSTSWPFDLESGVRVTCDVGYLCANFRLPRPVLELGRMYATYSLQTDVRQKLRLMHPLCGGVGIINVTVQTNASSWA